MIKDSPYFAQARLMLEALPLIAKESCFALKGGTAINLFLQNMPRLSVDIDLTYLPQENRETFLEKLEQSFLRIEKSIQKAIPNVQFQRLKLKESGKVYKLIFERPGAVVKIEPNLVLRGSVFPCEERELSQKAQEFFELTTSIKTLASADLYGGKICAALDRQHPRDFFDVKMLLNQKGLTENVRKAFVIYLASSDRPMNELLKPNFQDFKEVFEREFLGMTVDSVTYEELVETRDALLTKIKSELSGQERQFLLSIKQGEPEWDILGLQGIDQLPGIQWKLINIKKMAPKKHQESISKLRKILEI